MISDKLKDIYRDTSMMKMHKQDNNETVLSDKYKIMGSVLIAGIVVFALWKAYGMMTKKDTAIPMKYEGPFKQQDKKPFEKIKFEKEKEPQGQEMQDMSVSRIQKSYDILSKIIDPENKNEQKAYFTIGLIQDAVSNSVLSTTGCVFKSDTIYTKKLITNNELNKIIVDSEKEIQNACTEDIEKQTGIFGSLKSFKTSLENIKNKKDIKGEKLNIINNIANVINKVNAQSPQQ